MLALSGLAYEDAAPLEWKPLSALPEAGQLQQINAQNAHLLLADASLEEHRATADPKDDSQPLFQELHRLEFKVDIVLRLLSALLQKQQSLPPRRKFRIYARGLEWVESSPLSAGMTGVVSLYINPALPFPLELPCECVTTFDVEGEATGRAEFRGLNAAVVELLEKLIFRHHRRQVAEARHHPRPPPPIAPR